MKKYIPTTFDRIHALYRRCRESLIKELMKGDGKPTARQAAAFLVLTPETMEAFADHVTKGSNTNMYSDMDIPKYMFEGKELPFNVGHKLQRMELDTYMLDGRTGLLVDPVTREYCYVFWDECEQCSGPYPSQKDALDALDMYIKHCL